MSTRAQIRFATRESGQSFNKHPDAIHAQFYKHSDGYPESLGLDIADSIMNNVGVTNWEIEPLTHKHGDLDYIYYVWQAPGKETFISIFKVGWSPVLCVTCDQEVKGNRLDECIFVGLPTELIKKYSQNNNE